MFSSMNPAIPENDYSCLCYVIIIIIDTGNNVAQAHLDWLCMEGCP